MEESSSCLPEQPAPAQPVQVEEKLKAERIQLLLRDLPGWMVVRGGTAIARSYTLPSHRAAISFALFVNELAADHGHTADVDLRPNRVNVTLVNRLARGLTQAEFDLAKAIDMRE